MIDPNESIAVWDLAPDGVVDNGMSYGGAPAQFQATRTRALELIAAFPRRFRLVQPGDTTPTERSDGMAHHGLR